MTSPPPGPTDRTRSRSLPFDGPAWAARLALAFVLLALASLVVAPLRVQARIAPLRSEAESADEARTLVTRVQFALAQQMSALRGALMTPDPRYPGLYAEALELERSAYPQLDSLTTSLPGHARSALVRLQSLSAEWHARLDEEAVLRREPAARRELLGRDLDLYEGALRAARDLDAAVAGVAQRRRAEIRRAEAREDRLGGALGAAALLAALAVGWFGQRMRGLAREAAAHGEAAARALAEARRAGESRERLMRGITHDLKNPLGAADGYAELLQLGTDGELRPAQRPMVEGIRRCIGTALGLITDLLDFSRAESGTLEVVHEPTECRAVVRETEEQYRGSARAAGHEIEVRLPDGPLAAVTDRARVLRIVGNLVSNAIKYTPPPGRVVLEAQAAEGPPAPGEGRWIEIRVCDTGPGIPDAERERIFDEFHRLHTTEAQGHGLGLATSRRIARLLGGDITVGEAGTGGAAFSLWLPTRAPEARP
ncbi:MAG TPA: ATP-binding protein [Longimicrobiaceae bacterium]